MGTPKSEKPWRKVTAAFAALLLLGVIIGIATYVYEGSAEGYGYVVGQLLLPGILLAFLGRKGRLRGDVALAAMAVILILMNGFKIIDTYDVRRFQHEMASAEDREAALATSSTQVAALLRDANTTVEEVNAKIDAVFRELNEGSLERALAPSTLASIQTLNRYEKLLNDRIALAETAKERIDVELESMRQRLDKAANRYPGELSLGFKRGLNKRLEQMRSVYQRRVDLTTEVWKEAAAILAFVRSREGQYRIENGSITFDAVQDAEAYNAHFQKLQALGAQEQELDEAVQAHDMDVKGKRRQLGLE